MPSRFRYTARNAAGRFISGNVLTADRQQALLHLRTRALVVTSIEAEGRVLTPAAALRAFPVSLTARVVLFRSLATMLSCGVPLRRALDVATVQCLDDRLGEALRGVLSDLETGSALSDAMARRPGEFADLHIALVRAGELGGTLEAALERIASLLEFDRKIRKRLWSSLTYPGIILAAATGLVLFLVADVVPMFATMFDEMHVPLPWSTAFVIACGAAIRNPLTWLALAAATVSALGLIHWMRRDRRVVAWFDTGVLFIPLVGRVVRSAILARFSRVLATLLRSGVALDTALASCRDIVGNAAYVASIREVESALSEGKPLTVPLERSRLYDAMFVQLVRVGEESGSLDSMLLKIAEYRELDVEASIAACSSILEPLLMIVLGAIVGTIVASLFIPLYSIIGSIK